MAMTMRMTITVVVLAVMATTVVCAIQLPEVKRDTLQRREPLSGRCCSAIQQCSKTCQEKELAVDCWDHCRKMKGRMCGAGPSPHYCSSYETCCGTCQDWQGQECMEECARDAKRKCIDIGTVDCCPKFMREAIACCAQPGKDVEDCWSDNSDVPC